MAMRINSYWTTLSEISRFVNFEQVNNLLKPKAEAIINRSARHWQATVFCDKGFNTTFNILVTKFVFIVKSLSDSWEKRYDLFHARAWLHLWMSEDIIKCYKKTFRASSYGHGNRVGWVIEAIFVVCSKGKFQPGRQWWNPRNITKMVEHKCDMLCDMALFVKTRI